MVAAGAGVHKGRHALWEAVAPFAERGDPVYLSAWANTGHWLALLRMWLDCHAPGGAVFALRPGIVAKRTEFVAACQASWGPGAIRLADTHVGLVVCGDAVFMSAGFPRSDQFEWFDIREDAALADMLRAWFDELPFAEPASVPPERTLEEILGEWHE